MAGGFGVWLIPTAVVIGHFTY